MEQNKNLIDQNKESDKNLIEYIDDNLKKDKDKNFKHGTDNSVNMDSDDNLKTEADSNLKTEVDKNFKTELDNNLKTELDKNFKYEVMMYPGGEHILNCYLCGTCTAGCPVSEITASYNPRKIIRMVLLGYRDEILNSDEIWRCEQCHICVAHCPQDVRLADVIRALRGIAIRDGIAGEDFASLVDDINIETRKTRLKKINELIEKIKNNGTGERNEKTL